ncbi:sulfotransferase domain-containing protein [Ponticoccus sp. SC2-23]|nr:sulfotransferase domain-containing protein [Ponticoccus sp. SC6-9]MBM1226959.1 sulfotransferase domain-containing protein [Ponticoccus sp. SC6-15]MBM1231380.1 sulfotransferase domain-containing protein [Ponticoccus sp. SC6-38]MBM1235953.1 sulfotransferase domain-containing protein [Ponticoccus sp. SC6-45]MBM1240403.1 sulfotransferase domain-containing protein [Ponticoccus sp. SC6-49]MBM1244938.1 sulfotransferase domain-containing protein [Ponticoccus sp. SC2-64]MBM1249427.1 sulfotransferas
MLIINNGVPKSGSTWMQTILRNHIDPQYPSETWANGWMNPSVDHEKLEGYIASGEWRTGPTLLKLHLTFTPEFAFLDRPEVRIVVSYRNLPDSVVSWFHHQKRQGEVSEDQKQTWLEGAGRRYALRAAHHRLSWQGRPNAILIRYEDMLQDAAPHILNVMEFVGVPCTALQAARLAEDTQVRVNSKAALREGQHVRTGGLSVARDELPPHIHAELEELQTQLEAGSLDDDAGKAFLNGTLVA